MVLLLLVEDLLVVSLANLGSSLFLVDLLLLDSVEVLLASDVAELGRLVDFSAVSCSVEKLVSRGLNPDFVLLSFDFHGQSLEVIRDLKLSVFVIDLLIFRHSTKMSDGNFGGGSCATVGSCSRSQIVQV